MRFDLPARDSELVSDIRNLQTGKDRYRLLGYRVEIDPLSLDHLYELMAHFTPDEWEDKIMGHLLAVERINRTIRHIRALSNVGAEISDLFRLLRELAGQGKGLETKEKQYTELKRVYFSRSYPLRNQGDLMRSQVPRCLEQVMEGLTVLKAEENGIYYLIAGDLRAQIPSLNKVFDGGEPSKDNPYRPLWVLLRPYRV